MNELTIFIYLASVIPNIGGFLIAMAVILGLGLIVRILVTAHYNDTYPSYYDVEKKGYGFLKKGIFLVVVVGLLACLVPDKTSMYMMVGSEAGEYVVNTDQGQQIINDIQKTIHTQLENLQNNNNRETR